MDSANSNIGVEIVITVIKIKRPQMGPFLLTQPWLVGNIAMSLITEIKIMYSICHTNHFQKLGSRAKPRRIGSKPGYSMRKKFDTYEGVLAYANQIRDNHITEGFDVNTIIGEDGNVSEIQVRVNPVHVVIIEIIKKTTNC